jgi:hypothetical protein
MRKRTQITVETDRVLIVRRRKTTRAWCRNCGSVVDFVPVEQAGRLPGNDPKTLDLGPDAEKLHLKKAADGSLLVCLKGLLRS